MRPIKVNYTVVSSCSKYRYRKQGLVLQCIICHFSSEHYVCAVTLIPAALKKKQKATARGVQQMPAPTSAQEAPDPSRKLQALLRSPSFTGSTPTCISIGTRAHCWNVWGRHLLAITPEQLEKETDASSVTRLHRNNVRKISVGKYSYF